MNKHPVEGKEGKKFEFYLFFQSQVIRLSQ